MKLYHLENVSDTVLITESVCPQGLLSKCLLLLAKKSGLRLLLQQNHYYQQSWHSVSKIQAYYHTLRFRDVVDKT